MRRFAALIEELDSTNKTNEKVTILQIILKVRHK